MGLVKRNPVDVTVWGEKNKGVFRFYMLGTRIKEHSVSKWEHPHELLSHLNSFGSLQLCWVLCIEIVARGSSLCLEQNELSYRADKEL